MRPGAACCNQSFQSVTWNVRVAGGAGACLHWATMLPFPRWLSRAFALGVPPGVGSGLALCLALALAALSACAAAPEAPVEWRLLVKVATPSNAGSDVAERVTRTAGVPARYVASVSPQWHGVALRCSSEAACAEAVERLKADTSYFLAVERDERRRTHGSGTQPS